MKSITRHDLQHAAQGFLMGSADIVPGVSGGTVALVLGIYQRLVLAISHFDGQFVRLLATRQWNAAATWIDFRFLVALGIGIATGIGSLASLMHYLLEHQRSYTLAVFFGLIAASSILVGRMVHPRSPGESTLAIGAAVLATVLAYWIVGLDQLQGSADLGYLFFCGVVAICAMILPGISGAYILWMLGTYLPITGSIKSILHLDATSRDFVSLGVLASGCAVGLIGFSKLLQWLLANAPTLTMAVLGGFMVGSLRKMWPFQRSLNVDSHDMARQRFENLIPSDWGGHEWACAGLALVATMGVLALERWGSRAVRRSSR